jgi:hypothetical protein
MSYVLGWKTRSNVYVAADSMITSAPTSIDAQSSFGERQISEGGVSVAERGLKIVVDGDLAIGLCGDSQVARSLAASLFRSYRRLRDPEAALHEMLVSNGPFSKGCGAQLIVAWRGEPCPRLFSFNREGCGGLHEYGFGEGVPLGSVRPIYKGVTQELLKRLFVVEPQGSAVYLASALGMLQSLGVRDYLVDDGVGGSFTGVRVTRQAIAWQPDLLYVIDEPGENIWSAVATCVRDDTLVVNSTLTNQARVFMTDVNDEKNLAQWVTQWGALAGGYITDKRFDFVVLLGLRHHVVIVIEMRRTLESKALRFHSDSPARDGVTWFELRADLVAALRRPFADPEPDSWDFRFGFEAYGAPPV